MTFWMYSNGITSSFIFEVSCHFATNRDRFSEADLGYVVIQVGTTLLVQNHQIGATTKEIRLQTNTFPKNSLGFTDSKIDSLSVAIARVYKSFG